jgi:diguanylate cyclase (GGDEF)-like protein
MHVDAETAEASLLRKANERLILENMRARIEAETAVEAYHEVAYRAQHDPLTQLPNRVLLLDRFEQAISSANRHGTFLAVLFIDLNEFKQINDTYGHSTGDQVLKLVAQRLTASVRESDTVSRHGGDEFLILLSEITQASDAALTAAKILAALGVPAKVGDHVFPLSASIGVSVYPEDGLTGQDLIERADKAMYDAKRRKDGSGRIGSRIVETQGHLELPIAPRGLSRHEQAIIDYEATQEQLIETNHRLSEQVDRARQLLAEAEAAHRRQTEFMTGLARDMTAPLAPSLSAVAEMDGLAARQQVVDMASVIEEVVTACTSGIEARDQHLLVHLPPQRPEVLGDPARLAQAFHNLLENASKYTQNGGEISVLAAVAKKSLEVTISDNGSGMDARTISSIFHPFVRGSRTTELGQGGLGLGLTLVRQFVEAHGGHVSASSAGEGLGSQFRMTLPLLDADPAEGRDP